jgi:hypothetical protein
MDASYDHERGKAMTNPELPPISPELRHRLKEDIRRRGILVPILMAHDGQCLDGRLRLAIAEELGLTSAQIPKIVIGRVSQSERADIRLSLNLFRRQLTQAQIRELLAWELRRRPEASDRALGQRIGVDHKTVGGVRKYLEGIGEIPRCSARQTTDGRQYPSDRKPIVFTASNAQAVEAQRLLGELGDEVPDGPLTVKKLRRIKNARDRADALKKVARQSPDHGDAYKIFHCDFRHLGNRITPCSVDLALCDPPWSIAFAHQRQPFAQTIQRLLKPDGLLCCYTGVAHLPEFLDEFRSVGLSYQWTIVGRRQVSSVQQQNMLINRWVPIAIFAKGKFRPLRPLNDIMENSPKRTSRCIPGSNP